VFDLITLTLQAKRNVTQLQQQVDVSGDRVCTCLSIAHAHTGLETVGAHSRYRQEARQNQRRDRGTHALLRDLTPTFHTLCAQCWSLFSVGELVSVIVFFVTIACDVVRVRISRLTLPMRSICKSTTPSTCSYRNFRCLACDVVCV
jgi:hypothetical protein